MTVGFWPTNLQALVGAWQVSDIAAAGATWTSALAEFPTQAAPLYDAQRDKNVLIVRLGANDLLGTPSLATLQARAQAYYDLAVATGFQPIVSTITAAIPAVYDAPKEAVRVAWNAWALTQFPAVLDLAGAPQFQDPTDLDYFDPDGWHTWGPLAQPLIASLALAKINSL